MRPCRLMVLVHGLSLAPGELNRPFWMATEDRTELRASMVTIWPLTRRTSRESAQLSAAIATIAAASAKRNDFTCSLTYFDDVVFPASRFTGLPYTSNAATSDQPPGPCPLPGIRSVNPTSSTLLRSGCSTQLP